MSDYYIMAKEFGDLRMVSEPGPKYFRGLFGMPQCKKVEFTFQGEGFSVQAHSVADAQMEAALFVFDKVLVGVKNA